jgi:hypothetical protein
MSNAKSERARDKANYNYFVSLADSRASLTNLPMMALLTAIMLGLVLIPLGSMVFFGEHHIELLPLFYGHLMMIGFSLLMFALSAFQRWVFRYQVLASSFTVFFAVVGWVYACCFLALGIAAMVEDPEWSFQGGVMVSGDRLALFALIGSLYVCGTPVVHVLLLRKRLREGHSEKRTMGNYLAASSVYSSKGLWIIFAVVVIGPNVLTGGRYVLVTVGTLGFILFASVLTSLPAEFGYLTYLKSRDKKYWEERPPKIVMKRAQKIAVLKKIGKWVLIVLAVAAALVLLPLVWP